MVKRISKKRQIFEVMAFFLLPLAGVVVSVKTDDWTWFARFGSVMVALSVLLFFLYFALNMQLLLKTKIQKILDGREAPVKMEGLKNMLEEDDDIKESESQFQFILGTANAFFGTLIWGFGDLVVVFVN